MEQVEADASHDETGPSVEFSEPESGTPETAPESVEEVSAEAEPASESVSEPELVAAEVASAPVAVRPLLRRPGRVGVVRPAPAVESEPETSRRP